MKCSTSSLLDNLNSFIIIIGHSIKIIYDLESIQSVSVVLWNMSSITILVSVIISSLSPG